jgi:hypothetical protein
MTQVHLTLKSSNAKTGPIPVSTTGRASCPTSCPFQASGCYADNYGLNFLWNRVTNGAAGSDWATFCAQIKTLPDGQLWRHNQAGDLPQDGHGRIDGHLMGYLVAANIGKRGFTYTHHDPSLGENAKYIKGSNDWGFTVNLSANTPRHADTLAALEIAPVVVVLPSTQTTNTTTPQGRSIVICPATTRDDVTCESCQLCARVDRKVIVGFPAHGSGAKKAEQAITFWSKK